MVCDGLSHMSGDWLVVSWDKKLIWPHVSLFLQEASPGLFMWCLKDPMKDKKKKGGGELQCAKAFQDSACVTFAMCHLSMQVTWQALNPRG